MAFELSVRTRPRKGGESGFEGEGPGVLGIAVEHRGYAHRADPTVTACVALGHVVQHL